MPKLPPQTLDNAKSLVERWNSMSAEERVHIDTLYQLLADSDNYAQTAREEHSDRIVISLFENLFLIFDRLYRQTKGESLTAAEQEGQAEFDRLQREDPPQNHLMKMLEQLTKNKEDSEENDEPTEEEIRQFAFEYLRYYDTNPEAPASANEMPEPEPKYKESMWRYATELLTLNSEQLEEAKSLATQWRDQCVSQCQQLGIEISRSGESITWALWDIGKQLYLEKHPDTFPDPDNNYHLGNPLTDAQVQQDIQDRHLGWEAHEENEKLIHVLRLLPEDIAQEIVHLIQANINPRGSVSSWAITKVGRLLRENAQHLNT